MTSESVKTLLITTNNNTIVGSFLFQVLRYFTSNGMRAVYIAPEPISSLPPTIQDNEVLTDPEIMRLVSFHYLPGRRELLEYLTTMNTTRKPPSTIIIQNMEFYCDARNAGLVCTIALSAADICSLRSGCICNLIVSFKMPIPPMVAYSLSDNVWYVDCNENDEVVARNLNPKPNQPSIFHFSRTDDSSRLIISKAFQND